MTVRTATTARQPWQHQSGLRLLALLGLLVGFALRLYHLGTESLWYDETVSVALAQKSIPALIRHTAGDIHPSGYYLLLHFWQQLTHPTPAFGLEFLYAWPSAACGLLLLALGLAFGRKLYTPPLGVVALWLMAINPYHIWYSQEVRMYTLGALLGLLCLWALLQWGSPTAGRLRRYSWLIIYPIASAAGLYTLYYFLFILVVLNGFALLFWARARWSMLRFLLPWLAAQCVAILLWAPWLPVFWRQATDPPVPPWRVPWETSAQLWASLAESASALISGQSAPAPLTSYWILGLLAILLASFLCYTNKNSRKLSVIGRNGLLIGYVLVPVILIYAITWWWTPLYHVRYLFTYAPPLLILFAAALLGIYQRWRSVGMVLAVVVVAINGWSLYRLWHTPTFQRDNHRAAVAQVATQWRPGDAILVNAGWVYPALTTYWPTDLVGVDAALPPPLLRLQRLIDVRADRGAAPVAPMLVRTGSVEGASTLGWGDPSSDFFAMSAIATPKALLALSQDVERIWHYRLYDTVSDPTGLIRTWLDEHTTLQADTPISGRDYLRVQLYQTEQSTTALPNGLVELPLPTTLFTGELQLTHARLTPQPIVAGEYLYTKFLWHPPTDRSQLPPVISLSLRLYSTDGILVAQQDETPLALQDWPATYAVTLALPIPVATPPGTYTLTLLAYDQQTGQALPVLTSEPGQQALALAPVQIAVATHAPVIPTVQASFAYIDLVETRVTPIHPIDQSLPVTLVWRPQASPYRDTYVARLALVDVTGRVVQQWEEALGGWDYPSGNWPPLIPVRDWRLLSIDPATTPGTYTMTLQVVRNSDGQLIRARHGWWQADADTVTVGTVTLN